VLSDCLDSLTVRGEVIVVDNASADSTVEIAKRTADIVVANLKNMGFAAAANQGVERLPASSCCC